MSVELADLLGEEPPRVFVLAARALLIADQKDLVHAHVHRVGVESVDQLVQQVEDHRMDPGMAGAPLAAVNALVVGRHVRRFVELGIGFQKRKRAAAP